MKRLTQKELDEALRTYTKDLNLPIVIDDVCFFIGRVSSFNFRYKNATGLIFADNGYLGPQSDNKDYYLLGSFNF